MSHQEIMSESLIKDFENVGLEEDESEGWLRICSRKTKRKSKGSKPIGHCSLTHRPGGYRLPVGISHLMEDDNLESLERRFYGMRSNFLLSKPDRSFLEGLIKSISQAFSMISKEQIRPKMVDVLCLGLGNPAADRASLHQLVVLDLLLQFDTRMDRSHTQLYDPLFKSMVRALIQKLGMHIIPTNKEGCYKLASDRFHFIFLPHCAPVLINNLLYTNWSPDIISRLILFSNGWKEVRHELTTAGEKNCRISNKLAYISALESVVQIPGKEYYMQWSSNKKLREYGDFEGMRIQCFPPEETDRLPKSVWNIPPYAKREEVNIYSDLLMHSDKFSLDLIDSKFVPYFVDTLNNDEAVSEELVNNL
ncbi:unnamed protein product [Heterobilharzia americana]|nr:unnamed protein product [Heterobilharzia americana]